ncbi:MAG: hypothetical protein K2X27_05155 [Candidatus Obscuribacterales bacterium]|nr:hypothetical protein [Candidatus Obscuribacterales bacterium]
MGTSNNTIANSENHGKKSANPKGEFVELKMSLKQPAWHVMVLGIFTFKLYFIYWAYKNWRDLSNHLSKAHCRTAGNTKSDTKGDTNSPSVAEPASSETLLEKLLPEHLASFKDCSPFLRTVVILFPYLNNYLLFTLALGIARLVPDKNSLLSRHPYLCSFALVATWIAFSLSAFLPNAYYLIFLLGVLPLALLQHWLNSYWDSVEENGLLTRHAFSFKELSSIIVGALALGYIVTSFFLGIK